jgi:hypothetical protein
VGEVRNDNANSATQGGGFTLSNGVTLTANAIGGSAICVAFAGTSGNSASLIGNATAGTSAFAHGANNSSSGTLNITGSVTGGALNTNAHGLNNASTGTVNITGNATGGGTGPAAINVSTGTINITGNVTAGGGSSATGAQNSSTGTIDITGNVTGGSVANALGASNSSTGAISIVGSAFASNNAIGVNNASTGILNVKRAVGNDWGIGATGMVSAVGVASANVGSQTRVEEFEYGALGQAPTSGAVSCPDQTTNVCLVHRLSSTKKTLIDAASVSGALPAAGDVRSGVTFNVGNSTGTCAVPAAGSVALGVAVDATTGTAVLTPAAVWDALTSGMTTSGSIGARLKNAATLDSTGQQLADALSPVP